MHDESQEAKLIETESKMIVTKNCGGREIEEVLMKEEQLVTKRWINSGALMHSILIIVNNTVYFKIGKRLGINVLITKTQ